MAKKGDLVGGILYIVVGILFVGFGVLGINLWQQGAEHPERPIWEKPSISMKSASMVIMPVGFLGGLGLVGFGVVRLRGGGGGEGEETDEA